LSSISFFNPQFFFALFFIAVIVLIHFLKRPRTINLNFSTLRFFTQNAVMQRKTRNLRKFLQLLTRCAIATVLIVLFARPFNPSDPINKLHYPQTPVYLWVDPTLSMDYTDGPMSIGQLSCSIIDSLHKLIPNTSKLFLFDHESKNFILKEKSTQFISSHSPSDLENAMEQIQNSDFEADPFLIILSDFQVPLKSVLERRISELDKRITVVCIPVTPHNPWNYSLSGAEIRSQNNLTISTFVKAHGRPLKKGELIAETGRMRIGRTQVNVAENEKKTVEITGNSSSGNLMGKISLKAQDPLLFDNYVYFVQQASASRRVVIIGNKTRCKPIAFALNASSKDHWKPLIVKDDSEITYDDLDSADLVIINESKSPSYALKAFLSDPAFIKKPVVIACDVDENARNVILQEVLNSSNHYPVHEYKTPLSPVLPDTTSQLWQHFPRIRSEDVVVYRRCNGIEGEVLLRLTDGSPLIIKTSDNNGRSWLVFTTPIGVSDANNLSETGFFVPMIDRICKYIMSHNKLSGESYVAGVVYRNPYFGSGSDMTIFDDQSKLIKIIHKNQPFFHYEKPGIYKIAPAAQPSFFLAVQPDSSESILEYALPDTDRFPSIIVRSKEKFLETVSGKGQMSLTIVLWIILASLLLAELLLWERHKNT
jgi:hypothetical protein